MNIGFILPHNERGLSGISRYSLGIMNAINSPEIHKYCYGENYLHADNVHEMRSFINESRNAELAFKEQIMLTCLENIDIIHSFYKAIPIESCPQIKKVLTIHDLSPLVNLDWFGGNQSTYEFFDKSIRRSAVMADKVVAVSQATKNTIIDLYQLSEDKIEIVNPAIASGLIYCQPTDSDIQRIKEKYSIKNEYILSICTLEPRKNLVSLIKAYEIYREHHKDSNINLVLTGKLGWQFNPILEQINKSRFKEDIIITDYVSDSDLAVLYKGALVFAYVSYYEGFGMPILEALSYGNAVLTSSTTSMPEVGGDAACYCDPYDLESIISSLEHLVEDEAYRNELKSKAKNQAKKFSYQKSGEKLLEIFKSIE